MVTDESASSQKPTSGPKSLDCPKMAHRISRVGVESNIPAVLEIGPDHATRTVSNFATNMAHRREAEPPDMLGLDVDAVALPGRRLPLLKALRWNP